MIQNVNVQCSLKWNNLRNVNLHLYHSSEVVQHSLSTGKEIQAHTQKTYVQYTGRKKNAFEALFTWETDSKFHKEFQRNSKWYTQLKVERLKYTVIHCSC